MSDKDQNHFEELLKSLQDTADENATLAKSLPAENPEDDDETIEAAAADGDSAADENEGDADDKDKAPLAKSMAATVDGEEVEVVDATEMIKSLVDRVEKTDEVLAKALQTTVTALQDQQKLIKSLSDRVEQLGGQGRGRKTVITVHEKTTAQDTLAKSQTTVQPTSGQILAKALDAQKSGKLTGLDVSRVEAALNHGVGVPADIMQHLS